MDREKPMASTIAWRALLEQLADLDESSLTGDRALDDEASIVEGYRFLATVLGVAMDSYVFSDRNRPQFLDVNTPLRRGRRWGGDNTDAFYSFTPIDPERLDRVYGRSGDSAYFSITVYNEPSPGVVEPDRGGAGRRGPGRR